MKLCLAEICKEIGQELCRQIVAKELRKDFNNARDKMLTKVPGFSERTVLKRPAIAEAEAEPEAETEAETVLKRPARKLFLPREKSLGNKKDYKKKMKNKLKLQQKQKAKAEEKEAKAKAKAEADMDEEPEEEAEEEAEEDEAEAPAEEHEQASV